MSSYVYPTTISYDPVLELVCSRGPSVSEVLRVFLALRRARVEIRRFERRFELLTVCVRSQDTFYLAVLCRELPVRSVLHKKQFSLLQNGDI